MECVVFFSYIYIKYNSIFLHICFYLIVVRFINRAISRCCSAFCGYSRCKWINCSSTVHTFNVSLQVHRTVSHGKLMMTGFSHIRFEFVDSIHWWLKHFIHFIKVQSSYDLVNGFSINVFCSRIVLLRNRRIFEIFTKCHSVSKIQLYFFVSYNVRNDESLIFMLFESKSIWNETGLEVRYHNDWQHLAHQYFQQLFLDRRFCRRIYE